jgi:hypothetical protein
VRWHDNRKTASPPGGCRLGSARGRQHHLHEQNQDRNQCEQDNGAGEKVE